MKAISLFSGAGGDTLGLELAGIDVIAFSENNKDAIRTHEMNFVKCKHIGEQVDGDILKIKDEDFEEYSTMGIDMIIAGFPCQGFSNAGKKNVDDPRNSLFREVVRVVRIIRPTYVIGENVTGILTKNTPDGKSVIQEMTECFKEIGYNLSYRVYDMSFCLPQSRRRVIFVACKNDISMPVFDNNNTKCVKEVLENVGTGVISYKSSLTKNKYISVDSTDDRGCKPMLRKNVKRNLLKFGVGVPFGGGEIIDIDKPSKTITCSYSYCPKLYVPIRFEEIEFLRCFTIRELSRIQGFPDDFEFVGNESSIIRQIGNAIPPVFIQKFVNEFLKINNITR